MSDYRVQHGGTHGWNAGLRSAKPGSAREVPAPIQRDDA